MQHFLSSTLPSIDLDIPANLRDREYRQAFFLAESSALIAKQLIALRKRRRLNQTDVAKLLDTGQPAISRVERADYRNWSFNTLRRLAEAMDARLRVYIEPAEDVISEYIAEEVEYAADRARASAATEPTMDYSQSQLSRSIVGSAIRSKSLSLPNLPRPSLFDEGRHPLWT
jgi:transcriptional regulator with XRE-family HTH domain